MMTVRFSRELPENAGTVGKGFVVRTKERASGRASG
jgi:hypothetical protein